MKNLLIMKKAKYHAALFTVVLTWRLYHGVFSESSSAFKGV
jgi:hypothetical protein